MKSKGKKAWLITWEGSESEHNGRCKVVSILRSQIAKDTIGFLLPILFSSEYTYTLCEKMSRFASTGKDPYFMRAYRDINPEHYYGQFPKIYLHARRVEDLRCEYNKNDDYETTLYWTELERFTINPDWNPNGPMPANLADLLKQVRGKRIKRYTYSIRSAIKEELARKAKPKR